ncbi:MAG: alpha/beta hydrolase [Pseudomonadota bacterium]
MVASHQLTRETIDLDIDGTSLQVAAMHRPGTRAPVVFLHGFGSTKEDCADLALLPQFEGRGLMAFDAPGCGETACSNLAAIDIPFLHRTAEAVLKHFGVEQYHLVGHSMGGLTALKLASVSGGSVLSFTNIEGNLAPEDCILSRQIIDYPAESHGDFMAALAERSWQTDAPSFRLYAASLPHKVRAGAVAPIFRSMVEISDNEDLLGAFTGLACAKMFVYGDANNALSYLGTLMRQGVQLAEISQSGHWPMYANPTELWARLAAFIDQSEATS